MHGFFGTYGTSVPWNLSTLEDKSLVKRIYSDNRLSLTQLTLPKFLGDKYFEDQDGYFLSTEGVLLEADSAAEAITRYRNGEVCFWDGWRGSFAGVLYDKKADTLFLFNDHVGSKMLFYTRINDGFVFSSDLKCLAEAAGERPFDEHFVQTLLNEGRVEDNRTMMQGIHRLLAGEYVCVCGKEMDIHTYHQFDNTPWSYDEQTMLKETDRLFRQAVERVVRKNEQEGLHHFFPLSGGLDSRMTQWIAKQIATEPIVNFTYSQSGHYDHLLPREISQALGNTWQFFPLDGGAYITDIDRVCALTEWLINYMGPVEIAAFAQAQDWTQAGVVLTGVNGDNIMGTETDNAHEMARIYTLGFNGNSLGSPLVLQHYTESYSPFCDVDVLDYVLHVPTIKRRNYYFYDQWIMRYYPDAAQWHHKHVLIGHRPKMVTIAGRNIALRDVPLRAMMYIGKKLHLYDAYKEQKGVSMTPYDDWIKENPHLLSALEEYYTAHRSLLNNDAWLSICDRKMRIGSILEKGKVLTVLSALTAFSHSGKPTTRTR